VCVDSLLINIRTATETEQMHIFCGKADSSCLQFVNSYSHWDRTDVSFNHFVHMTSSLHAVTSELWKMDTYRLATQHVAAIPSFIPLIFLNSVILKYQRDVQFARNYCNNIFIFSCSRGSLPTSCTRIQVARAFTFCSAGRACTSAFDLHARRNTAHFYF